MWSPVEVADAPKGEVMTCARRAETDAECVLCGGPLSHGDWQVTIARRVNGRREPAHTHCAGDAGWRIR